MNNEVKQFSGTLNSDDSNEVIPSSHHKMAVNGRFRGNGVNCRFEGVEGNYEIPNVDLQAGDNQCIGSFYDKVKQRLFWFNYNSNGYDGIYYYDIQTDAVVTVLVSLLHSTTPLFNFDLNYPIASVNIVYTTEADGDLLLWVARNKRPKELNIKDALLDIYSANWKEEYLDLQKAPPSIPIKCAYEDDSSVTVNYLHKVIPKFSYRWQYGDFLNSCFASDSEIPVPYNYTLTQVDNDPTKNAKIALIVQTGAADVRKIEIAVSISTGNVFGDYSSVVILDKDLLSIPDNDVYVWRFYNNELYTSIDPKEKILVADYIPDYANAMELLNGNVPIFGGMYEGKNPVDAVGAATASTEYPTSNIVANCAFSVTQNGGNGNTGNVRFVVIGNLVFGTIFTAKIKVSATTYTITYTSVVGDDTSDVIAGLSTSASGQGFTVVSSDANNLVISRSNQVLLLSNVLGATTTFAVGAVVTKATNLVKLTGLSAYTSYFVKGVRFVINNSIYNVVYQVVSSVAAGSDLEITCVGVGAANETIGTANVYIIQPINQSVPSYNNLESENIDVVYFDEKGKTNGITELGIRVSTLTMGGSVQATYGNVLFKTPYLSAEISSRPPIWAKYYHLARRTPSGNFLYWLSDRTYKDDKFAYISIDTITSSYKILNPTSIIGYDFSRGDRIRFYIRYNAQAIAQNLYGNTHDYEIADQVINPDINGVNRKGQFLKIVLPTISADFDFNTGRGGNFGFYYIQIYSPLKEAQNELGLSYEFSERYEIFDAGLETAHHQGMLQNQSDDLATPATFKLNKGSHWYRTREIALGGVIQYDIIASGAIPNIATVIGLKIARQSNVSPDYIARSVVPQINYNGTQYWCIANVTNDRTFNIKGQITCSSLVTYASAVVISAVVTTSAGSISFTTIGTKASVTANETFTYDIDFDITMPQNSSLGLVMKGASNFTWQGLIANGQLTFTDKDRVFSIGVIDKNFSDFFISAVNSNSRAFVLNPDEKETYYPTTLRWGLAYQQNTNINQINRFYPDNFDEVDRSKGDIQRLRSVDKIFRVYQNDGVGRYGVYARFIQSNGLQLTTTDAILAKNNIQYYLGSYGMGGQYCSLVSAKNADYFKDPIRGYDVRLSEDGFTALNQIYKGAFYIRSLITPYNKDWERTNGSNAKILGTYNFNEDEYVSILQGGTNGENTIPDIAYSFNESRNAYCSFFDFADADWIANAEEYIVTWKNGKLYKHTDEVNRTKFFGTQFYPSITLVFNDKAILTKTFQNLRYQANQYWIAENVGDITTSGANLQTGLQQISQLIAKDFTIPEGKYTAAFLRDANSKSDARLALVNGDVLKGQWLEIKLVYKGSDYAWLYLPTVASIDSPKNF